MCSVFEENAMKEVQKPRFMTVLRAKVRELHGSEKSQAASALAIFFVDHEGEWLCRENFRRINVGWDIPTEVTADVIDASVDVINEALALCGQTKLSARTVVEQEEKHPNWQIKLVIEGELQPAKTREDFYELALRCYDQLGIALQHLR